MSFFATWQDSWRILNDVLEKEDVNLLPDLWYPRAEPAFHTELSDGLKESLVTSRRVFIVERGVPLALQGMVKQEEGPREGQFRVDLERLAEGLSLTLPGCYGVQQHYQLYSGSISHPKRFHQAATDDWRYPSEELRQLYDRICSLVRHNCRRIKPGLRSAWVGQDAARLISEHRASIVDRDM